jgi:tryptophanyl-tRNA synthetase
MDNQVIEKEEVQNVTPWSVEGKVDYEKLIKQFGTERLTQELLDRFAKVTGKDLHPWLKRGIFFCHRSFDQFLTAYENGEPVFLYTGRGPTSDAMHIGHLIPFMFTKWLQEVFDCPLVIQISDEEKAAFKKTDFSEIYKMGFENAKEIISLGFNPEKTFIFSNRDYRLNCKSYETFVSQMKMIISLKEIQKIFGLNEEGTIAMYDWPFYQSAAGFYQAFPHIFEGRSAYCLVPHAIDQDPYFRLSRDIATKMNLIKTCTIQCTFIPPLTGVQGKMSSSTGKDATLFLTDSEEVLREKIKKHSFSGAGGNGTLADHKKFGGIPEVDIAYQYLRYFENDDAILQDLHDRFKAGDILCEEMKGMLADKIIKVVDEVKANRSKVTQEVLDDFYAMKQMKLPQPKTKKVTEQEENLYEIFKKLDINFSTKYHGVIATDDERNNVSLTLQGTLCKVLFLKGPKDAYYLYLINHTKILDMKTLHKKLEVQKVRFGESDTQTLMLKIPKNAATIFSIFNDSKKEISTIYVDEGIKKDCNVNFHPMRPDATTTISYPDMIKFIEHHQYELKYVKN